MFWRFMIFDSEFFQGSRVAVFHVLKQTAHSISHYCTQSDVCLASFPMLSGKLDELAGTPPSQLGGKRDRCVVSRYLRIRFFVLFIS